jgi:hypothetical protein
LCHCFLVIVPGPSGKQQNSIFIGNLRVLGSFFRRGENTQISGKI